jgi:Ca-activated chloride channel homolog
MTRSSIVRTSGLVAAIAALTASATLVAGQDPAGGFRFRSAVELINVTATVTDSSGRFVSGLGRQDFEVFEDGVRQTITHFSNERVPVSLGIVLDISGSMAGERFRAAEEALRRFTFDLLSPEDELFLMSFNSRVDLVTDWTSDRYELMKALSRIRPRGGTALYDAVAEAVPMAQGGRHKKKAVVVLSDGVDNDSQTRLNALQGLIRETEVLVYAIGIDSTGGSRYTSRGSYPNQPRVGFPFPFPIPQGPRGRVIIGGTDEIDVQALRDITDDSGGRTEVTRGLAGIDTATASIADELSRQYSLGYVPPRPKDGRWHTIDVSVDSHIYTVRHRRGYLAH